ncbi:N-6 DNA methylase, partial [Gleimia europaea]|nr:N-6 DNA methylase [Gleimia europaea]
TDGTAAIVQFPGTLYRGGAEKKIRKYLIDGNYVDSVIQLPPDLFFGTTIATCIVALKKSKSDNKTLFIDASAEFVREGNKNVLTEENRKRILNVFASRTGEEHFASLIPNEEIQDNDYNLSVSAYVEPEDTREVINITELNEKIRIIVARQQALRAEIDEIVTELEGVI